MGYIYIIHGIAKLANTFYLSNVIFDDTIWTIFF